jgi:2-oxoglutarate ferredoxin oxidoreductase subunit beta
VFGDTGGQQTATTVIGQRTKTSLEGRDAETHGFPVPVADLVAKLRGTAYVARAAVSTAAGVAQTKRMLRKAFEVQLAGRGFGLVEILTMCPTGWFVPAAEGANYQGGTMEQAYPIGELVTP